MSTKILLDGAFAQKIILSEYVERKNTILNYEEDVNFPQTMLHEPEEGNNYFMGSKNIKLWPNMIDFTTSKELPNSTNKCCWWDRHPIGNIKPLGCPIAYTEWYTEGYTVGTSSTSTTSSKHIYETIGLFCSFPCCKAYILENINNPRYKDSLTLLTSLFIDFCPGTGSNGSTTTSSIPVAPTWKTLKSYGGHLEILEYRESFKKTYIETINYKRCVMLSSSQYIEERGK